MYTYLAPLGPGDGILSDEQDRKRTTHMKMIGPVPAGMATLIHLDTGKVVLVQVTTTDQEMNPGLMVLRGGAPHVVDEATAQLLADAGLGEYLTPL